MVTSVQQEASRPMVHQRQPDDKTCWITVVAMLADIPVEQLLAEIREEFGESYQEIHDAQVNYDSDDDEIAANATNRVKEVTSWIARRVGFDIDASLLGYIAIDALNIKTRLKAVKLYSLPSGRGAISLFTTFQVIGSAIHLQKHSVAYSDGMVFDPGFPKPMSLAQFRHEYAGTRIDQIWVVR